MTESTDTSSLPAGRAFAAILFAFCCFGALFGIWQVVLEDLRAAIGINKGALGVALTVGFFASLPTMLAGGRIADRFGVVPVIAVSAIAVAVAYAGLAVVDGYVFLIALMLLFFGFSGVLDVGINAAAVAFEQATGRRALGFFHAAFSAAAAASAILAGITLSAGISFRLLYLVVTAMLLILAAVVVFGQVLPRRQRADDDGGSVEERRRNLLYRNSLILLLAGITLLGFFGESALSSWSAIYLRGSLDMSTVLGASGVAVFHIAMAVGRLAAGAAVIRFSRRVVLAGAGLTAAAGMTMALATPQAPLILGGFVLVGLGLAVVAPIAFSIAGDVAPGRAGEATSVITVLGYGGLLIGPAMIGLAADVIGLRAALAAVIVAGVAIALLSTAIRLPATAAARQETATAAGSASGRS